MSLGPRSLPAASLRRAFPLQPRCRHQASHGCTKSSTMASELSPARPASGCGSIAGRAMTSPTAFRSLSRQWPSCAHSPVSSTGEAVSCGDDGIASFNRIRYRRHDADVFMWAFDLIELDGADLRPDPLHARKDTLGTVLMRAAPGVRFNEHMEQEDGSVIFHHACKLGLEGMVSKHGESRYHSGRSRHWIKSKNPLSAAVRREAEMDWQRWPRTARSSSSR
jgi:hypothetical protein